MIESFAMCWWSVKCQRMMVGVKFNMLVVLCEILFTFPNTWFCYCKIFSCCICGIEALHNSLYIFVRQSLFLLWSKKNNLKRCISQLNKKKKKSQFPELQCICCLMLVTGYRIRLFSTGLNFVPLKERGSSAGTRRTGSTFWLSSCNQIQDLC